MKAEELRIGNWILCRFYVYSRIESIGPDTVIINTILDLRAPITGPLTRKYMDILPIPLTLKWLLNFGFKDTGQSSINRYYSKKGSGFIISTLKSNGKIRRIAYRASRNHGIVLNIEYVHQFQNIFFAMTGKELTIKP